MRRKWLIRLALLTAVIALAFVALDQRLIVRTYTVESDKVDTPIRLAVLTDYHGCDYGANGIDLLLKTEALKPDAILLVGDMFSADPECSDELAFFEQLQIVAPTFYVTGNHEYWEQDMPALMVAIAATGVTVLDQNCVELTVNDQLINICGIPDPYSYVDTETTLSRAAGAVERSGFTILMAHRPELIDKYAANGSFDLVVSGHAHGGQVRIPGVLNGLFAPNQGFFPEYAGGQYQVEGVAFIVSRGLARESTRLPRIFNRPELVVVELE